MATALAGGVAAVVLALVGGSGAPGSQPLKAHGRTPASTGSPVLAACAPTARHVAPDGKPDRSLLSILPILRRPARPSDALPAGVLGGLPFRRDVLVRYMRRARSSSPSGSPAAPPPASAAGSGTQARSSRDMPTARNRASPCRPAEPKWTCSCPTAWRA